MVWARTYVYAGGLIATMDKDETHFRLTDWLGNERVTTSFQGVYEGSCASLPFGDGLTCTGESADPHHFTGKERDTETGNDYFGARYYASSMGRFMSPDWSAKEEPVPYAQLDDPQSLNLYAYVMNNPLSKIDSDGHQDHMLISLSAKLTVDVITIGIKAKSAVDKAWNNLEANHPQVAQYLKDTAKDAVVMAITHQSGEGAIGDFHAPGDVPNGRTIVRGGLGEPPPSGTYSGAQGTTLAEAGKGVPNGTVSATTAGQIRAVGGDVRPAPEPAYEGGPINGQHVNVTGGQSAFGSPEANPAPKSERIPGGNTLPKPPKPNGGSN
jgi:RHS repeat-associated protein